MRVFRTIEHKSIKKTARVEKDVFLFVNFAFEIGLWKFNSRNE